MSLLSLILYISSLSYPRCTHSTPSDPDSDCGSTGWAFTLFIAWNLLSMVRQTDNNDFCELTPSPFAVYIRQHVYWYVTESFDNAPLLIMSSKVLWLKVSPTSSS